MATKILICEDNKPNLELMVYLLGKRGYSVLTAMDGEIGLEMSLEVNPSLIICDIQLPKMDGFQIIKRLKAQNSVVSHIPVIAITAFAMVGDKEKILATGYDGYIAKPIEPAMFVSQIESYLSRDLHTEHISPQKSQNPFVSSNVIQQMDADYKGTVLVVDDNIVDQYLSEMLLKSIQLRPVLADSVNQALEIMAKEKPDLILSDYHLPDKTGIQFLQMLRSSEQYNHIPFLILSSSLPRSLHYEFSQDIAEIIYRPIEPKKFIELIESAWQRRQMTQ